MQTPFLQDVKLANFGTIVSTSKVYRQTQNYGIVIEKKHQQLKGLTCNMFDKRTDLRRSSKAAEKKENLRVPHNSNFRTWGKILRPFHSTFKQSAEHCI